ncbi:MAG: DUF4401 domain-containing protein [Alphaproteobacteria bacterium]|nr:DUF4401 domain-containing protein [Alphaproteobacteria bacterium]
MSDNHMTAYKARELFTDWLSHGLIRKDQQAALEQFAVEQQLARELPLYLRVMAGIGAFITALCLVGFLDAAHLISFDLKYTLILWGTILMGGAILLARVSGDKDHMIRHSFLVQTSFCFMGAGKILFVMGMAQLFKPNEGWGIAAATFLVTLATYNVYRMSIDRFLSSLAVLVSVFCNLMDVGYGHVPHDEFVIREIAINAFFIAQLAVASVLMANGRIKRDYIPLAYAFISSLAVMAVFFATQSKIGFWMQQHAFSPVVMNVSLAVTLVLLIGWAAGEWSKLYKSEPLILACLGALVLAAISAPGILLAVGLMVLGYARHERLIVLLGVLLFPLFLSLYYYNLDLSLMTKSGVLVASGCVLLAGRAYMHYRKFDQEV